MIRKIFLRFSDLYFILSLIILTIPVYQFLLNAPLYSVIGDAQRYNGYQAYIIKYSLDNFGQFALWDQFLSSGMSWISHPGGPLFFPTAWIVTTFFEDMMLGSRVYFFLHAITAVLAMYFFLRVLNLGRITSFLVSSISIATQYSLIFGINGWFEEFFGLTLMPLTIGLLWLSFTKKSYIYSILGGLAMSLHFFGNSYYVFHYNVIAILWIEIAFFGQEFWVVVKQKKRDWQVLSKYIISNIIFWTVFIGISAIKLLPLLEFREISARSILSLPVVEGNVLPFSFLQKILRDFIIPAGHTISSTQWANDLAILFLIISIIYFFLKKPFKYATFLGLLLVGIWGYLANLLPLDLYAFIYNFLPGFNSNNYPYRFMIIIHFAFLVLIALGFDTLLRRKSKVLNLLGVALGIIILFSTISYASKTTNSIKYQETVNIKDKLKNFPEFNVVRGKELNDPPTLVGEIPDNLITILSSISNVYSHEGRAYSNIGSLENGLSSITAFNGKIRSVHHSYNPIVPTYQYDITPQGSTEDSEELTRKRYKIFSVLNTRFQLQGKDFYEYEGCNNLSFIDQDIGLSKPSVCNFLENRLSLLASTEKEGLYYDSDVLSRVMTIPNPVLIISDNRFNDYSGFIAKQILFHPEFDERYVSILSGGSIYLDDYTPHNLRRFKAVILIEPKVKNTDKTNLLLKDYEKEGGRIIRLSSKWISYESLHERSGSLWTNKPAWDYSDEDKQILSEIFKSFESDVLEGMIDVEKFTPEDVIFSLETKEDNQALQFSDSFYPGWKAKIDGREVPVYMADGLVKGVIIEKKGPHRVRLYYQPDSLKKGAIISGVTIIGIIGFILIRRRF